MKGSHLNFSRGLKNAGFGILSQILTISVGIIIPRLVLVNLGSEANGLLSSIGNILAYMSLLEAGVGTATLQALYKPCAINDQKSINSIMAATDYFYRRTGRIYLLIVFALSIGYSLFVKSSLSRIDIFLVVLFAGISGVLSYYFQGKYKILLTAEGKSYLNTNIVTIIQILTNITKAILLYIGFGVVAVQVSGFVFNIAQISVYIIYMRRCYPWLNMEVKPDLEAINQRNAVLIHQISGLIFSNTDVLLLTLFTSLKEVSVYTMYAMIYGMVKALAVVLYDSYTYALGQVYNINRKRFLKLFDAYEILTLIITFSLYCICRYLMNPFLAIYTSGVNDISYVNPYLPWLFAVFYLLHNGRTSSATVINIAQRFQDTKWRSIFESIINITVSVVCVIRFGIYGVLLGTIAALLYRSNDMIIYAARILKRSCWITYKRWILNITVFAVVSWILDRINISSSNYYQLLISAICVSLFTISIFVLINALVERENMNFIYQTIKNLINPFK